MDSRKSTGEAAARLGPAESDIAGRAVFAWALVPAAGRLVHELAEGRDARGAVAELRAAVRLLDRLGWPDDESEATRLDADEADVVREAARTQVAGGANPDRAARDRVARGHAAELPRRSAASALLDALGPGRP